MKKDILNRADLTFLVDSFYEKLRKEKELDYYFSTIANTNWEKHNKLMCDFWENILFHTSDYEGNPMKAHEELNELQLFKQNYFRKVDEAFRKTVDENFSGKNARFIKKTAKNISSILVSKLIN